MWKVIYILIIFNTNTGKFEESDIQVIDKKSDEIAFDLAKTLTGSKYKEFKFIKVIKDSVYVPDDNCYKKTQGLPYYFEELKEF